jgi:drug/metabolite transporter (DMT)-like permease
VIVATGALGALAIHLLTLAYRSAPASMIAPFEYSALLWGVGIDWLAWDTLPGTRVYIGGSIVVLSGLYLIWRESRFGAGGTASDDAPATRALKP